MIKQSKINSFINLIEKTHSKTSKNKYHNILKKHKIQTEQSQALQHSEQPNSPSKPSEEAFSLHYTQQQFKQTFKDRLTHMLREARRGHPNKYNLYDAYRESLEKKQTLWKNAVYGCETSQETVLQIVEKERSQSLKKAKEINFPINRPHRQVRFQMSTKRHMRKRQLTSPSLLSTSFFESPKRIKTENLVNKSGQVTLKKILDRQQFQDFKMPSLNHEPLFRIKRYPAITFEADLAYKTQIRKQMIENTLNYKAEIKRELERSPLQATKIIVPLRESWNNLTAQRDNNRKSTLNFKNSKKNQRYSKKSAIVVEKSNPFDRVEPWEYDQKQIGPIFEESTQRQLAYVEQAI